MNKLLIAAIILGPSAVYVVVAIWHAWLGEQSNHPDDDTWNL